MLNLFPPFPDLRYAYLRAVARAWNDEAYLTRLVEASNRGECLQLLESEYNFRFRWNIDFRISADPNSRGSWAPSTTGGWWNFGVDRFDIWLPGRPIPAVPPDHYADVLAHYSARFPSMLNRRYLMLGEPGSGASERFVPEPPASFLAFGVVTARLIAATWRSSEFAGWLFSEATGPVDTVQMLESSMDIVYPWNVLPKFHQHDAVPSPDSGDEYAAYWSSFPRTVATVHIPWPPAIGEADARRLDVAAQPVALAAYNGDGDQYPFTCV